MTPSSFGRTSQRIIAMAIAAAVSGCAAGGGPPDGPAAAAGGAKVTGAERVPGTVLSNAERNSKRRLFVSNLDGSIRIYTADIHHQNPPMIRQITQGATRPLGDWIDRSTEQFFT